MSSTPLQRADQPSESLHSGGVASSNDERVLLAFSPAPVCIVLRGASRLILAGLIAGAGLAVFASPELEAWGIWLLTLAIVLALLALAWEGAQRRREEYTLTSRRVVSRRGIFRTTSTEALLGNIQQVVLSRSLPERVLGLGSIGIATASSGNAGGYDIVWRQIPRPKQALESIRAAIDSSPFARHALGRSGFPTDEPIALNMNPISDDASAQSVRKAAGNIPIIGIAGGIGSGKSTIARAFEKLGCYVIDSDARAKAALDRPEVRGTLVEWWGAGVLHADGRVDRAKVANIIFASPEQRTRLEALVHPIVRQDRARLIEEAARFWPKAVIVDAPLLFEAGVDRECDVVVFVDVPKDERLRRVYATRGWDEQELTRREMSQMPLEHKRARCQFVVPNTGTPAELDVAVARVLQTILVGAARA